jgi:hypothetical protein
LLEAHLDVLLMEITKAAANQPRLVTETKVPDNIADIPRRS